MLTFVILAITSPAFAQCDSARTLANIHDNYRMTITETGVLQTRAAARLYPLLAALDRTTLTDGLKLEFDRTRLNDALNNAETLAKMMISGAQGLNFDPTQHLKHADRIARLINRTSCAASGGGPASATASQRKTLSQPSKLPPLGALQSSLTRPGSLTPYLIAMMCGLMAGGLVYLILKSRLVRIHRMNRQTRKSIQITFDLAYTDETGRDAIQSVTALDISVGGMKLRIDSPMPEGTALNLKLKIGDTPASVVWTNTHYAGIMFDDLITDAEVVDLGTPNKNSP